MVTESFWWERRPPKKRRPCTTGVRDETNGTGAHGEDDGAEAEAATGVHNDSCTDVGVRYMGLHF